MTLKDLLETKGQDGDIIITSCNNVLHTNIYRERIASTNGQLDMLYAGHVSFGLVDELTFANTPTKPLLLLRADLRPETLLSYCGNRVNQQILDCYGRKFPGIIVYLEIIWRAPEEKKEENNLRKDCTIMSKIIEVLEDYQVIRGPEVSKQLQKIRELVK